MYAPRGPFVLAKISRVGGAALLFVASLMGCASDDPVQPEPDYARALPEGAPALELVDPADYPDFRRMYDDRAATLAAIDRSLEYFGKPSSRTHPVIQGFTPERIIRTLEATRSLLERVRSREELAGFLRLYFEVYRSVGWDGSGEVLFTAYCQPVFDGSRQRTARFGVPLLGLPSDLVKETDGTPLGRRTEDGAVVPYYTRGEIETRGVFDGQGLEIAWVESELDAFIIHVQGSAKLRLQDGGELFLGYSGKTDRPYTSIGQELVKDGRISAAELSLAKIREYFASHAGEQRGYLHRNESYVFFVETGPGGPYGSLGAPVTPYRTIATDKSIFPRGALCAVETAIPALVAGGRLANIPHVAFALDQDTGGAIRSAGRCDLFVGTGGEAERVAGHTQSVGSLYYLLVKESAPLARR